MSSFATPPPQRNSSPPRRQKSASPWRVTRYSPYLPNPARNPLLITTNSPSISNTPANLIPNPLYQPQSPSSHQAAASALPERIIRLTLSFTLRENGRPRGPTEEELPELQRHFPTLQSAAYQHPYLVLIVKSLPSEPWPVLVADIPLWLTTKQNEPPVGFGQMARAASRLMIKGELIEYETPSEETILEIFEVVNEKGAGMERIQWDGLTLHGLGSTEPQPGWKNILPSRINGFLITYDWNQPSMEQHAQRTILPTNGIFDDTRYDYRNLRPGVLIGGFTNNMTEVLSTTSGICLQSPHSNRKYITVAAHGFSAGVGDAVYHPGPVVSGVTGLPDARYQIGIIEKKFGDTDICLATLEPGVGYQRQTFCDPSQSSIQPFRALKNPKDLKLGDAVYMNTPVNGLCEGVHVRAEWALKFEATAENPAEKAKYCEMAFFSYFGNGSDVFFDGSCGGVIWDDNFDVLGQFRFQAKDGSKLAFAPSFKMLMDQGYILSSVV